MNFGGYIDQNTKTSAFEGYIFKKYEGQIDLNLSRTISLLQTDVLIKFPQISKTLIFHGQLMINELKIFSRIL